MVATGGKKSKNSWTSFVMKIKKEENLPSLKEAMKRASERKSEWKRGGNSEPLETEVTDDVMIEESESPIEVMEEDEYVGGRARRSASRGRARSARRSASRGRARSARRSASRGRARTARRSAARGRARSQRRA
jgi:hypothetical protein